MVTIGRVRGVVAAFAIVLLAGGLPAAAANARAARRPAPRVTVIGDSVADGLTLDRPALRVLARGLSVDLETAPCRRLEGVGCPVKGVRPPSVVALAGVQGRRLGRNVVVAVGYNDFQNTYARFLQDAVRALRRAGVRRVWLLTLRAVHHPYLVMNDDIRKLAQRTPDVYEIDWNRYSRSHPGWFRSDGLHLQPAGATALATLIRKRVLAVALR